MLMHSRRATIVTQKSWELAYPRRLGILNDYVRIPFANGSSFASQFLCREFVRRGHEVSIIGPGDPEAGAADLPEDCIALASGPLRTHPGVRVALPTPARLKEVEARNLDLVLGQSGNELIDLGIWLRAKRAVPFLAVNTMHLPSYYHVILPSWAHRSGTVTGLFDNEIMPRLERHAAHVYNQGDGLIVLSRGLERYWRERGVHVPIHVIPRAIDPSIFEPVHAQDPFDVRAPTGQRLLCVCRHSREKDVTRLIEIFARYVAPNLASATLTLVGDGPDHAGFVADAQRLGVCDRVFFPGEVPLHRVAAYYRHADLFVYTSRSETYGQVVSEALFCGLPVVAFDDDKGVADQLRSGLDGVLVPAGASVEHANWRFGGEVVALMRGSQMRHTLAANARRAARLRCSPQRCIARYYDAFDQARTHCERAHRRAPRLSRVRPLARWATLHSALLAVGLLRPPAPGGCAGRKQPGWCIGAKPPMP